MPIYWDTKYRMPVKLGKDDKGCYAQWGSQKKYYYSCGDKESRKKAKEKAHKQGAAARSNGYKGD